MGGRTAPDDDERFQRDRSWSRETTRKPPSMRAANAYARTR
jgi:hypothetical protein